MYKIHRAIETPLKLETSFFRQSLSDQLTAELSFVSKKLLVIRLRDLSVIFDHAFWKRRNIETYLQTVQKSIHLRNTSRDRVILLQRRENFLMRRSLVRLKRPFFTFFTRFKAFPAHGVRMQLRERIRCYHLLMVPRDSA